MIRTDEAFYYENWKQRQSPFVLCCKPCYWGSTTFLKYPRLSKPLPLRRGQGSRSACFWTTLCLSGLGSLGREPQTWQQAPWQDGGQTGRLGLASNRGDHEGRSGLEVPAEDHFLHWEKKERKKKKCTQLNTVTYVAEDARLAVLCVSQVVYFMGKMMICWLCSFIFDGSRSTVTLTVWRLSAFTFNAKYAHPFC